MSKNTIREAIADIKSTTSTCPNDLSCVNLILNIRQYFFNLPAKEHVMFIEIAEEECGIFFDNQSCVEAMQKCTHTHDYNALIHGTL